MACQRQSDRIQSVSECRPMGQLWRPCAECCGILRNWDETKKTVTLRGPDPAPITVPPRLSFSTARMAGMARIIGCCVWTRWRWCSGPQRHERQSVCRAFCLLRCNDRVPEPSLSGSERKTHERRNPDPQSQGCTRSWCVRVVHPSVLAKFSRPKRSKFPLISNGGPLRKTRS